MKLHLPASLRKALLIILCTAAAGVPHTVQGASRSDQLTRTTYCDFGDNKGRYAVHGVNELLEHLRKTEGTTFTYLNDQIQTYTWDPEQPLINYDSRVDSGPAAGIGYNFIATVQHNGVIDPTFTASTLGDSYAIHYAGIEYRSSTNNTFLLVPGIDYKVTRLSKVITDVTGSGVYTGDYPSLNGKAWYRSGSGTMYVVRPDGSRDRVGGAYSYCIGGIMDITSASRNAKDGQVDVRGVVDDSGSIVINKWAWWNPSNINQNGHNPLPFVIQAGDSGSPTWIYDEATQSYLYAGAMQSGEGEAFSQARYAGQWTEAVMKYFNREVQMGDNTTVHIGAPSVPGTGHTDDTNNVTSHPYQGRVTAEGGEELQTFLALQSGKNTWKSLSGEMDKDNWYAYGNSFLNTGAELAYADLFETQDLVFQGQGGQTYEVKVDADVDLGLGYARFSKEGGEGNVRYNISNNGSGSFQFNTSGFIVDEGVDVYTSLTGSDGYAREWRKIGDGSLHIAGSGDNHDVLLNLGGSGTTYLEREGGYAAYNVLANNGTRVVINDTNQIKRDFTFGYGGAVLDMNGNSMEWNNSQGTEAAGFTIHALTDEAVMTNAAAGSVSRVTWTQGGRQEYLGSFVDTAEGGVLQFAYNGGDGSRLVLHSIYTDLHNTGDEGKSGIFVESGTLALQGTNTLHAPGSLGVSFSNARYFSEDDWHYADSKTDVTVTGGTFELGHHARLTGTVTVQDGGTFLMREGVTQQFEYAEGGYVKLDTDSISDYYGLKGDVHLEKGGTMNIEFNSGVATKLTYGGKISGQGTLNVNPGVIGGLVVLSGDNTGHTGEKVLSKGGMYVSNLQALGDTSAAEGKWRLTDSGYLVLDDVFAGKTQGEILQYIHAESDGILALTENTQTAYDLSGHSHLIIGANQGESVHYGTAEQALAAQVDSEGVRAWRFGGGGGELVVDFQLKETDDKTQTDLVLGSDYAKGVVYLTNEQNDFRGTISFKGGVTLKYDSDAALGNASFSINYTNRVLTPGGLGKVQQNSKGALLVDRVAGSNLDLSNYGDLYIGVQEDTNFTGNVTVAQDATYRFGASTGKLVLQNALAVNGRNDLDVDGQTFSGGEIRLEAATEITGDVSVRGCNQSKASQAIDDTGDIILSLGKDNAISRTNSVTLHRGGYLELGGTTQELKDLEMKAGSRVYSAGGEKAQLTVAMTKDLEWAGAMDAATVNISGSHKLTMSGSADFDDLYIAAGSTVMLNADNALSKFGTTHVEEGATLDANRKSTWGDIYVKGTLKANNAGFSGVVTLDKGTINLTQGSLSSTSTLISKGGTLVGKQAQINGMAYFTEGETRYRMGETMDVQQNDYPSIAGTVDIAKDASLILENGGLYFLDASLGWKYSISSAEFNVAETLVDEEGNPFKEEKGTLKIQALWLYLNGADQNFGGTVNAEGDGLNISAHQGTKTFDKFVNSGTTRLTNNENNSPASWVIHELAGGGTLKPQAAKYVKLDGAGTFNGTLAMEGGTLELAHEQALESGNLSLNGSTTLAVSAETARVKNLNGSGTIISGVIGDKASTRNTTLEITGDGGTFSGSVASDAQHGLSLLKTGTGTQTFSGADVKLRNVAVQSGTLAFSAENAPQIYGNVSIAKGATLDFGPKALTLATGQTLGIQAGDGNAAVFAGDLEFAGGRMVFAGETLSGAGPAFRLSGAARYREGTSSLLVNFTNDAAIQTGHYQLGSGNWQGLGDTVSSTTLVYHTATFSATAEGLFVDIGERTDIQVWSGQSGKSSWTKQDFGSEESKLQAGSTAVFNDAAGTTMVSVNSAIVVQEMVMDNNTKSYMFAAGSGSSVQAESLRQLGAGTTELAMGSFQIGEASVEAGTLILGLGSSVGDISVAENAAVALKAADTVTGSVTGGGSVRVDWGQASGSLDADVAALSVEHGRFEAGQTVADVVSVKDGGQYYATAGTHTSAMQLEGTGRAGDAAALQLGNGAVASGRVKAEADAAVGVDSEASATVSGNVDVAAATILTKTGEGTLTLGADNSATLQGKLVVADGTVKVGNAHALGSTAEAGRVVVAEGGSLDINGTEGAVDAYSIIMDGGTLTNTGGAVGTSKRQVVTAMILTANSSVRAESGHDFALIANGYAPTSIDLQGNTLEKTGFGTYTLTRTTVKGGSGGTLKVSEGTLNFLTDGGAGSLQADIEMAGGTVSGTVNPGADITVRTTADSNFTAAIATGGKGVTFTGEANLTVGGVISGAGNILADGGGTVTLNAANTFTGSLVVQGILNEQGAVTATTTLKMGNNAALGSDTASITIGKGGIVNLNGTSDVCYKYTLAGGALLNNGNGTNTGNKQTAGLTLTDDSSFGGSGNFKLLNSGYNAINVSLNGHTLTKTGNNTVGFYTTTFDDGSLEVQGGKLEFNAGGKGANKFSKSAEMVLNVDNSGDADRVSGQVNVVEGLALRAQQSAKASVAVSLSENAALTTGAEANQTLNMTGAVSGSASTTLGKTGEGTANLSGSMAGFHGSVNVEGGILNIMNAASVDMQDVTIGANSTLGVYNGTTATADTEHEGTLTIKNAHSLTAKGAGATLNANVVMESGSTLDLGATGGEGLTLGSSLTLQENVNLSDADFEAVAGLGYGESYILFNGVDSLTLGQTTYTEVITPEMQIDAADWFHSVEAKNYYVVYDGSNVGQVAIFCATPEPTTSTLSLLALAALAVRRRRK